MDLDEPHDRRSPHRPCISAAHPIVAALYWKRATTTGMLIGVSLAKAKQDSDHLGNLF